MAIIKLAVTVVMNVKVFMMNKSSHISNSTSYILINKYGLTSTCNTQLSLILLLI